MCGHAYSKQMYVRLPKTDDNDVGKITQPGTRVRVEGLQTQLQYNGLKGVVLSEVGDSRISVRLDQDNKKLRLQLQNVRLQREYCEWLFCQNHQNHTRLTLNPSVADLYYGRVYRDRDQTRAEQYRYYMAIYQHLKKIAGGEVLMILAKIDSIAADCNSQGLDGVTFLREIQENVDKIATIIVSFDLTTDNDASSSEVGGQSSSSEGVRALPQPSGWGEETDKGQTHISMQVQFGKELPLPRHEAVVNLLAGIDGRSHLIPYIPESVLLKACRRCSNTRCKRVTSAADGGGNECIGYWMPTNKLRGASRREYRGRR